MPARGRKAQRKLHLLNYFISFQQIEVIWLISAQKLAGLKFRDWRPSRSKANFDNFSHNRFVDRQLFGKWIISKFQSQKLAGLKFRELAGLKFCGLKFCDWRPCRPKAKFDNFSHNRFVDRNLFGEWIIFKFQYHMTFSKKSLSSN